ncbi:glutathione S-transferase [Aspergillus venezuelensis]
MSFGTLYTHNPTPRSTTLLALAKLNGLDLEIVYAEPKNEEAYEALCKHNSLGQVPTFVSADGDVFSECIPLTLYFASQAESTSLLGDSQRASLEILQWMSFANCDLFPAIGGVFLPRIGQRQIIRQNDGDSLQAMLRRCRYIEDHLNGSEYLIGESATVADFFTASMLMGAYAAFRRQMVELFPLMSRWYEKVRAVEWYKEVAGEVPDLGFTMPGLDAVEKEIHEPTRDNGVSVSV